MYSSGLNNNNECDKVFLEREIEREKLQIADPVGDGFYGIVYKAYVVENEIATCVALKTLKGKCFFFFKNGSVFRRRWLGFHITLSSYSPSSWIIAMVSSKYIELKCYKNICIDV